VVERFRAPITWGVCEAERRSGESTVAPVGGDGEQGGRVRAWVDSCWHAFCGCSINILIFIFLDKSRENYEKKTLWLLLNISPNDKYLKRKYLFLIQNTFLSVIFFENIKSFWFKTDKIIWFWGSSISTPKNDKSIFIFQKLGWGSASKMYFEKDCLNYGNYPIKLIQIREKIIHFPSRAYYMKLRHYLIKRNYIFLRKSKNFHHARIYFLWIIRSNIKKGKFSESFASVSLKQAIEDVKYLQQDKIVHHVVKTSNNILDKKKFIFW
jgi:hypothetical protein